MCKLLIVCSLRIMLSLGSFSTRWLSFPTSSKNNKTILPREPACVSVCTGKPVFCEEINDQRSLYGPAGGRRNDQEARARRWCPEHGVRDGGSPRPACYAAPGPGHARPRAEDADPTPAGRLFHAPESVWISAKH